MDKSALTLIQTLLTRTGHGGLDAKGPTMDNSVLVLSRSLSLNQVPFELLYLFFMIRWVYYIYLIVFWIWGERPRVTFKTIDVVL